MTENDEHFIARRDFGEDRMAVVIRLTYDRGRLCVGARDGEGYDDSW